jgi:hypothetical protein
MPGGARVEIRVRGRVPAAAAAPWGMDAAPAPRQTVLRGPVADRSALHGVLERMRADGLEVVDVRPVPAPRAASHHPRRVSAAHPGP